MTYWQWAMLAGLLILIWVGIALVGVVTDAKKAIDQTNFELSRIREEQLSQWGVLMALEEWQERAEKRKRHWT